MFPIMIGRKIAQGIENQYIFLASWINITLLLVGKYDHNAHARART